MRKNLQLNENLVVKIMQLYESKVTRHGNMLVGATMSGKSRCWEILMDALNQLNHEEKEKGGGKDKEEDQEEEESAVQELLRVADRFQAEGLYEHCLAEFGRALTVETAIPQLVWAHAHAPENARAVAMQYVVANCRAIQVALACDVLGFLIEGGCP